MSRQFLSGVNFGSNTAGAVTTLSQHLALYSNNYGFSITAGRLNIIVPGGSSIVNNVNGTDIWTVSSTGGTLVGTLTAPTVNIDGGTIDGTVIGGATPAAGSFTNLTASGTLSGAAYTSYFLSPPAIGTTAPNTGKFTTLAATGATTLAGLTATGITASPISGSTGSFTTLAASSTVSGTGFSGYLAAPPAIGGTTPAAGSFTTLSATALSGPAFANATAGPNSIGRNRVDNGTFEVAQRTLPVTVSNTYSLDRWIVSWAGSGATASITQVSASGYTSRKQIAVAASSMPVGGYISILTKIEAFRAYDLVGQPVTVQFCTAASVTAGAFSGTVYLLYPNSGTDNWATGGTQIGSAVAFTPTATPTTFYATFPALPSTAALGLALGIVLTQSGSTAPALYWNTTSVQLEPGSVATQFERIDPVLNLQRCQRFYVPKEVWGFSYGLGGNTYGFGSDLPVFMHHLPTVNVASGASYGNCSYSSITATASDKVALCVITGATGAYTANAIVTASSDL